MAVSQDNNNNVYIVWWTNKSGNWEVMFRASTDSGATFGDKINLSNSPDSDSQNARVVAAGNNVYNSITGSSESMLRVSTDAGQTFGPVVMLGTDGTISTTTTTTNNTATATGEEAAELSSDINATGVSEEARGPGSPIKGVPVTPGQLQQRRKIHKEDQQNKETQYQI
jgi:hypothetical protein